MRVLADSHTVLWSVVDPERLSDVALATLNEAEATDGIVVSAVTFFDLWYKVEKGGIPVTDYEALRSTLKDPDANVDVIALEPQTAAHVGLASRSDLPDPFDRMIVATALEQHLPLVTKDKRITDLQIVTTIW